MNILGTKVTVVGLLFLLLTVQDASAKPVLKYIQCDIPHDVVIARLINGYNESLAGLGISASGDLVELWVSPSEEGTFTILAAQPGNTTCILVTGMNWEIYNPLAGGHL